MPPVVADLATPLSEALVFILQASVPVQTLINRQVGQPPGFVVPFEDLSDEAPLPIYVYRYVSDIEIGGVGDERVATMELLAFADGNDALQKANEMCALARTTLTYNAFSARGLEAYVETTVQESVVGDREETRGIALARLLLTIRATAP